MDLNFTPDELAFRDTVQAFLRDEVPAALTYRVQRGH
jgi:hypothetical protein